LPLRAASRAAGARPPAHPLRFGLLFRLRVALRLRPRVELAADELHLRDLGGVALAEPEAQQARVAALPRLEARGQRVEQLRDDLAVLQILHHEAARGERADGARFGAR